MFELYDYLYQSISEHLSTNSVYKDKILTITKYDTSGIQSDEVIVVLYLNDFRNQSQTLDYAERQNTYTFTVDVFCKNVGIVSGEIVSKKVLGEIIDFVESALHLRVTRAVRTPNIDLKVYRYQTVLSCLYDKTTKTIYPNN